MVAQTVWGMKTYAALFGALKVRDEVEVVLEGRLDPERLAASFTLVAGELT